MGEGFNIAQAGASVGIFNLADGKAWRVSSLSNVKVFVYKGNIPSEIITEQSKMIDKCLDGEVTKEQFFEWKKKYVFWKDNSQSSQDLPTTSTPQNNQGQ